MKLIVYFIAVIMLFISSTITAQDKKITVTINKIFSNTGKVSFALYNKTTFMKEPLQAKNAKIIEGKSTVTFENLEAGEYAVICYHDKNDNNKMDFSDKGMPLEDYGMSNNVVSYGPPNYEDAKFKVTDKNVSLEIKF